MLNSSTDCSRIELRQGQELQLVLASNPTTGYQWTIAERPVFLEVLQEGIYQQDTHKEGMVGVGGKTSWKFKVIAQGNGTLDLFYSRPWEKDAAPIKAFSCKLLAN